MNILQQPRVLGLKRAAILPQIACTVTLLKRSLHFIVRITKLLRKAKSTDSKKLWKKLQLKKLPAFLRSIIKRE
jgi:hypothetical protein